MNEHNCQKIQKTVYKITDKIWQNRQFLTNLEKAIAITEKKCYYTITQRKKKKARYKRWLHRITSMDKYQREVSRDKKNESNLQKKIVEIPKIKG